MKHDTTQNKDTEIPVKQVSREVEASRRVVTRVIPEEHVEANSAEGTVVTPKEYMEANGAERTGVTEDCDAVVQGDGGSVAEPGTPKIIHLCWFGGGEYPVEVKMCLESWEKILPDYKIRLWSNEDARAIGIPYINEALDQRKWAFAADVVRFYAVYKEGGVYMDSDILLYSHFDDLLADGGEFITFHEKCDPDHEDFGLQAAMFMGRKGNRFCKEMLEYYRDQHFMNPDGTMNLMISPMRMREVAMRHGYVSDDKEQHLDILTVYPTRRLKPRKRYPRSKDCIGEHRVVGSWRKRPLGRRITKKLEHMVRVIKYKLSSK